MIHKDKKRINKMIKLFRRGTEYNYKDRLVYLKELGFIGYADYLKSDLWKQIRSEAMKLSVNCRCCNASTATEVHHMRYTLENLKSFVLGDLVPVCRNCHDGIEFVDFDNGSGKKPRKVKQFRSGIERPILIR